MTKRQVFILATLLTVVAVMVSLGYDSENRVAIWIYGLTAGMIITTQVLKLKK